MPRTPISPEDLYHNVIHLLVHGQRTATYKLATMAALVDFAESHRPPSREGELCVPIDDLSNLVVTSYWRQLRPYDGATLRQSTQRVSRIIQAIDAFRRQVDRDGRLPLDEAARTAPRLYQKAVDEVALCLARQPLARLQRVPGSARSLDCLYDDSFLHDGVTRFELQRRNNTLRLHPGVAVGLAENATRLTDFIQTIWVDDVLRLNRLRVEHRIDLRNHLFDTFTEAQHPKYDTRRIETSSPQASPSVAHSAITTATFASRLNHLISKTGGLDGQQFSSGALAAKIRKAGLPMSVSAISQLRAGIGRLPSAREVAAIAHAFGVDPSYFDNGELRAKSNASESNARSSAKPAAPQQKKAEPRASETAKEATRPASSDRVFLDEIDDIASACAIRPNGCWLAPSSETVTCRVRNDPNNKGRVMVMALHRWSWMVDHGLTAQPLPVDLVRIHRTCGSDTCCNPDHLSATNVLGRSLTPRDVAILLERVGNGRRGDQLPASQTPGNLLNRSAPVPLSRQEEALPTRPRRTDVPGNGKGSQNRLPLKENLDSIRAYCTVDAAGCWVIPKTASVPCRADGDDRPEEELPKIAPHRWAWMVKNGRASNPLPSSLFQVWKSCGNRRCCNPEHLYLTNPDGEESSVEDAEKWLAAMDSADCLPDAQRTATRHNDESIRSIASLPQSGEKAGKHRAPEANTPTAVRRINDEGSLAERLNQLFDDYPRQGSDPLVSSEVAAALQEDGLPVSAESIERMRSGTSASPNALVLEALAYFFNVDIEYLRGCESAGAATLLSSDAHTPRQTTDQAAITRETEPPSSTSFSVDSTSSGQSFSIGLDELGRIVTLLSEAISMNLKDDPANIGQAAKLALTLAEVGAIIAQQDHIVIGRPLLNRIVDHLGAARDAPRIRDSFLPRLIAILEES